ncbi:acyltransferase family protein [Spirochaeta isovalerica]|uniref:Peptidoglycan/LPS O-acetylase OafA/YrhL n=1 Tax=Spirochaeta isovalerica TaxID=150 RepID=A0A841R8H0_9SPIO|nr:acyltransferase [Spirochaeta isovalerica]MBB6479259.1 peptidoglycan/LPS O-acetylase OafA/YrhL [Spirochaeta isovalerica]
MYLEENMKLDSSMDLNSKNNDYLRSIDGWRAISIIFVLLFHGKEQIYDFWGNSSILTILTNTGLLGVRFFFGISGFLITYKILNEIQNKKFLLKTFYIKRLFRIFPALLLYCITIAILNFTKIINFNLFELLSGPLFYANFINKGWYTGHFWSLSVEEHFYLFWPITLISFQLYKKKNIIFLFILLIVIWRFISWRFSFYRSPSLFWGRTDIQIDGLLWGGAIAIIYKTNLKSSLFDKLSSSYITILLFFFIFATSSILKYKYYQLDFLFYSLNASLIPIMLFSTIHNKNNIISKFLELSVFRFLGKLSYSIYLWQQLLITPLENKVPTLFFLQRFPISFLVTIFLSLLSYYLVEKKFILIGYKLLKKQNSSILA